MFDTMTVTKTLGALCGSLLVFLLGGWAAESLYHTGGHGEGEQAYVIDTGAEEAVASEDTGPGFAEVYAAAEPAKGEKVFNQCRACHKVEDGVNATGPSLYGVVGREEGREPGFTYSETLASSNDVWTPDHLNEFLTSPKSYKPGTKMAFAGLKKIEDRANLIAYLSTLGGTFDPAAAAPAEKAEAAPAETPAEAPAEAPAEKAEAPTEAAPVATAAAEPAAPAAAAAESATAPAPAPAGGTELAGDPAAGAKDFRICAACHKTDEGKNGVGPSLYQVVGRDIGSASGYSYSNAMKEQEGVWTPEKLDAFITSPKDAVPGTKMPFAGIKDAGKRQDLIAYLATIGK